MATNLGHHVDRTFPYSAGRTDRRVTTVAAVLSVPWLAAARAVFGGYFAYNGINHFMNLPMLAGYAASKGVPYADAAVMITGLMLLVGGICLILGFRPRLGAALIMLFLLAVTPVMHDFWNASDAQMRMNEFIHFAKNVAMFGGACFAMALLEPWPASVRSHRTAAVR